MLERCSAAECASTMLVLELAYCWYSCRAAVIAKREAAKHNVTDKAFKPSSPMKASACPGDYIGTLGGKIEHVDAAAAAEKPKQKGDIVSQPRNIVTSPAKKGGFGTIKTTLRYYHTFTNINMDV